MVKPNDLLMCKKTFHSVSDNGWYILFEKDKEYKVLSVNDKSFWYDPGKHLTHRYIQSYGITIEHHHSSGFSTGSRTFECEPFDRMANSEYIWNYFHTKQYWRKLKLRKLNIC